MRTILDALRDEIHSPVGDGHLENRLLMRGLHPEDACTIATMRGRAFQGAIADCLVALVEMPNITEGDKRIDLPTRELLLRRANDIYKIIGEPLHLEHKEVPMVYIGG